MQPLFIDTGAWIALEIANDHSHRAAIQFASQQGRLFQWITTNWVIAETITWLRRRTDHATAVRFGNRVRASQQLRILRVSETQENQAWSIFSRYQDKDFGFVDCTSFAVMESLGIQQAFAFDRHFRQAGYQTLPVLT